MNKKLCFFIALILFMACVNASQIQFSLKTPEGEFEALDGAQFQDDDDVLGDESQEITLGESWYNGKKISVKGDIEAGVGTMQYGDVSMPSKINKGKGTGKTTYGLYVGCRGEEDAPPCASGSVDISYGNIFKDGTVDFTTKNCSWPALSVGSSMEICEFYFEVTDLDAHPYIPEAEGYFTSAMMAPGIPVNLGGPQGKIQIRLWPVPLKKKEPEAPPAGVPTEGPPSHSLPDLYLTMKEKGFEPYPGWDYASYLDPLPNALYNLMAGVTAGGDPFAWTSNASIEGLALIKFFGNPYTVGSKLIADVSQWIAAGKPLAPDPAGAVSLIAYNPDAMALTPETEED